MTEVMAVIGLLVGLGTAFKLIGVPVWRGLRRLSRFLDDWAGDPPRPGVRTIYKNG